MPETTLRKSDLLTTRHKFRLDHESVLPDSTYRILVHSLSAAFIYEVHWKKKNKSGLFCWSDMKPLLQGVSF